MKLLIPCYFKLSLHFCLPTVAYSTICKCLTIETASKQRRGFKTLIEPTFDLGIRYALRPCDLPPTHQLMSDWSVGEPPPPPSTPLSGRCCTQRVCSESATGAGTANGHRSSNLNQREDKRQGGDKHWRLDQQLLTPPSQHERPRLRFARTEAISLGWHERREENSSIDCPPQHERSPLLRYPAQSSLMKSPEARVGPQRIPVKDRTPSKTVKPAKEPFRFMKPTESSK